MMNFQQLSFFEPTVYLISSNQATKYYFTPYYEEATKYSKKLLNKLIDNHVKHVADFMCENNTNDIEPITPRVTITVIEGGTILGKKFFTI